MACWNGTRPASTAAPILVTRPSAGAACCGADRGHRLADDGLLEHLLGHVGLEDGGLHEAAAVAEFQELDLALAALVLQPGVNGDGLAHVLGEVVNAGVNAHRGSV